MSGSPVDVHLSQQLLEVAGNPRLRETVYKELGEYCHQCRNRLNSLKLSLFLAMRISGNDCRDDWVRIERDYLELERIVERLQTICRPMTLSRVSIPLDLLFDDRREEWTRAMTSGGVELEMIHPRMRGTASFDVERMGQALDALVNWRAKGHGPDRVAHLRWWVEAGRARITWDEPNTRSINAGVEDPPWTLPLIARVAEAHGGEFRLIEDPGWRVEITWPTSLDPH